MAGYVWSPKAEVYCVRYRYYDPLLGRWLQRDPAGYVDGLNLYTYGMGNPWAYTDPYGLWSVGELWDSGVDKVKDVGGLYMDGIAEFGDLWSGRAAQEDADHGRLVREMERSQKSKICENYQNGNATADEAASLYGKVNGMASDLETALEQLRLNEWDMIGDTIEEITYTITSVGVIGAASRGVAAAARGTRFGAHASGPLSPTIANTFRGGSYTQRTLLRPTTMYRVHGGSSGPVGSFLTRTRPLGPTQARIDMALNPQWGNTASTVTRFRIPAGTRIFEGAAGPQGSLLGGGSQVFIPRVLPRWIVP